MRAAPIALLALSITTLALAADAPVKVFVNGKSQSYSPPAIIRGGTVYVPLRAGAKSLGLNVKWHADIQSAQICTDSGCVLIRQKEAIVVNGSLLLPLRKMGEATGAKVFWDAPKRAVRITK